MKIKSRIPAIIVVAIALLLLLITPAPALAGYCTPHPGNTWCIEYDFLVSDGTWYTPTVGSPPVTAGEYIAGTGWSATDYTTNLGGDQSGREVFIQKDLGSTFTITRTDILYDMTRGTTESSGSFALQLFFDTGVAVDVSWDSQSDGTDLVQTWTGSSATALIGFALRTMVDFPPYTTKDGSARVQSITIEGTGTDPGIPPSGTGDDPYQPMREEDRFNVLTGHDEDDNIISSSSIVATGTASSKRPSLVIAPAVYAAFTGQVSKVFPNSDGTYYVQIAGDIDGTSYVADYYNVADLLVIPGDTITGGCVLGRAGPPVRNVDTSSLPPEKQRLYEIQYDLINVDDPGPVEDFANFQDWTDDTNPSATTPCSSQGFNPNCLNNNSNFGSRGMFWYGIVNEIGKEPDFIDGQVTVPAGAAVAQDIEIPDGDLSTYILTVAFAPTANDQAMLTVSLGGDITSISSTYGNSAGQLTLRKTDAITPTEPDIDPDIYTLKLSSTRPVRITFACLQDENAPVNPPATGACYFTDPKFQTGDGWTLSGGASLDSEVGSFFQTRYFVSLPELASVSQGITLSGYSDGPATYTVTARARIDLFTLSPDDDYGFMTVAFDATDDDFDGERQFLVKPDLLIGQYSQTWTVTEGATATGTFSITDDELNGSETEIKVYEICISPDRSYWPDPTGTNPNVMSDTDRVCSQQVDVTPQAPTDIVSVGAWIVSWLQWVGKFLSINIDCYIRRALDVITAFLRPFFDWLAMIGRWFFANASVIGRWFLSLLAYLMALLSNLLNGIISVIWNAIKDTSLVVGLFDTLDLLSRFVNALISLALSVVALGLNILRLLNSLAQIIGTFWAAVKAAFNSTTATDVGIPICASIAEDDPLFGFCQGLDLFDYVLVRFPSLNVLGAVGIGAIALYTINKSIERVGSAFGEVG